MIIITSTLAPFGLLVIAYVGFLFASFSRRLGAVTRMVDRQRWFLVANGLIILAAISQAVRGSAVIAPESALPVLLESWFALVSFYIPLAIGVTLDLMLVWYYWGWTLREKI